jgi:hypothetical protein
MNVQTSRHFRFFVPSGPCLKGGAALVSPQPKVGAIQLQKTAFPQMNLQKDIRDCVQYD